MDYIKQVEDKLYSVYTLRKQIKAYEYTLSKINDRSGSESERILTAIREIQDSIDIIDFVVDLLTPEDQKLIRLWYYDRLPKKQICESLYSSYVCNLYRCRNRALKHFYDIYPW